MKGVNGPGQCDTSPCLVSLGGQAVQREHGVMVSPSASVRCAVYVHVLLLGVLDAPCRVSKVTSIQLEASHDFQKGFYREIIFRR